jgi:DNA-binding beta-propeller fold protein YncE
MFIGFFIAAAIATTAPAPAPTAMASSAPAAMPASVPTSVPGSGPLTAEAPIAIPRKPGSFDYMNVDAGYQRLLVAHSGNDALAIVDMVSGTVLQQVDLGEDAGGAGVAVDVRDGKYFVGAHNDHVVDINRKNMVLQAYITTPGPVDAIAFDSKNDSIYADEDNGSHIWVIDAKSDKLVATIALPAAPEYIDYDPVSDRVYQNIKPAPSSVLAIDPAANAIVATWPVAPAENVHGLAIDGASGRVFSVGANGELAVVDIKTGTVLTTVDVAARVDQIVFDPGNRRVYCPSGTGVMSVVQETDDGAVLLGNVAIPRHTHTATVDPVTHAVWISFGASDSDYVEKLTASP